MWLCHQKSHMQSFLELASFLTNSHLFDPCILFYFLSLCNLYFHDQGTNSLHLWHTRKKFIIRTFNSQHCSYILKWLNLKGKNLYLHEISQFVACWSKSQKWQLYFATSYLKFGDVYDLLTLFEAWQGLCFYCWRWGQVWWQCFLMGVTMNMIT